MCIVSTFRCRFLVSFLLNAVVTAAAAPSNAKVSLPDKTSAAASSSSTNLTTLRLVQIITRHGDRAPILPFPNDVYKNASVYSINGWGELTEIGAKQVYELGVYLRQRYDGFIPRKYRKRDFLMLSSDIDRTIMSAEANLAGLYELSPLPRSRDIFKEWQPVPIHTIPEEEDNLINGKADCPRYASLSKQFYHSDEFQKFLDDNKEFIDFVVMMSGIPAINSNNFQQIFQVQDVLRCQRLHNLTLPSWANSTVYEKLQFFKALYFVWNVQTDEMKRLKIGPLFQRLVEEMKAKVEATNLILNNSSEKSDDDDDAEIPPYQDPIAYRKMYVYSGHDSTISALLHSLNLFQPLLVPPYASAFIIELHRKTPAAAGAGGGDGTSGYFVELYYKNDTHREPYKLDPTAFCEESNCSFEQFSRFVQKLIPTDWKNECQLQEEDDGSLSSSSSSSLRSVLLSSAAASNNNNNSSNGSLKLPLMRMAPSDDINVLDPELRPTGSEFDENYKNALHPLGVPAPGLSAFVLSVIALTSLLASMALLTFFLRHKPGIPQRSSVYQHLS